MPLSLNWQATARADLLEIIAYIADDNPDAAQALKNDIEAKVNALPSHPELYKPGRMKGTREMVVHPNYVVVYQENQTEVIVLRVLHARQQWSQPRGGNKDE